MQPAMLAARFVFKTAKPALMLAAKVDPLRIRVSVMLRRTSKERADPLNPSQPAQRKTVPMKMLLIE